jgi:predicted transposase/invertase (TIGR01784 family)
MTFQITDYHDACFKSFFSQDEFVRDFIQYYIPEEIKSHLDLSSIEIDMEGYISEEFKEFYSDVVVMISFLDSDQILEIYFLFEHKSSQDRFARLQILNYQVQKWMWMLKNKQLGRRLPIIIPVIINHGTRSWKYSVDFEEYFRLPSEAFRDFIPKYRHILHDIHSMGDESFKTTTVMEVFHLLLKYIHYPEMDTKLQEIYDLIETLQDEGQAKEYLKVIVRYVLIASPVPTQRVVQHTRRFPGGEDMAGAALQEIREELQHDFDRKAEEYEQRGEQRGELKKSREMLLEAISEKFGTISADLVRRINSVESHETLKMLFKQTFRVDSLEEFKEQVHRATDN